VKAKAKTKARAKETSGGEKRREVSELSLPDAMKVAQGLLRKRFLDAAAEMYRRILNAAPDNIDAMHFLGLALFQKGDKDEGVALVERVVGMDPGYHDARNNLGNMLNEQGRYAEAEATYRQVLSLRPDHADAHVNLATILARRDDMAGAEAELRRAIECNPQHAEAYHNLGGVLQNMSRPADALDMYRKAMVLRPYDGASYRRVGAVLYSMGHLDEATAIYRRWVELEPNDPQAHHMLASVTGAGVPERASDDFVKKTFDTFAGSFDQVLEKLQYRAPALIVDAVAETLGTPAAALDVLDAGAGTGWCGPPLRPYARRLVGVDLSAGMLSKAAERKVYDDLVTAELVGYMRGHVGAFDLIVSADTLVYFGELGEAMQSAAGALRPGGHLVYTVEHAVDEPAAGHRLNPHGRYSHAEGYIRRVLADAGLEPLAVKRVHLRMEIGRPVDGLLVVARRPA